MEKGRETDPAGAEHVVWVMRRHDRREPLLDELGPHRPQVFTGHVVVAHHSDLHSGVKCEV